MHRHITRDLKETYLNRRLLEVDELMKSITDEDSDAAFNVGHRLKGNGETFGFPEISKLGLALELAALQRDKDKLREIAEEIESFVKKELELLKIM